MKRLNSSCSIVIVLVALIWGCRPFGLAYDLPDRGSSLTNDANVGDPMNLHVEIAEGFSVAHVSAQSRTVVVDDPETGTSGYVLLADGDPVASPDTALTTHQSLSSTAGYTSSSGSEDASNLADRFADDSYRRLAALSTDGVSVTSIQKISTRRFVYDSGHESVRREVRIVLSGALSSLRVLEHIAESHTEMERQSPITAAAFTVIQEFLEVSGRQVVVKSFVAPTDRYGSVASRIDSMVSGSTLGSMNLASATDEFRSNGETSGPIDVVWVVDNSGSMGNEQQGIVDNSERFLATLRNSGTDWRLAVTTTDAYTATTPRLVSTSSTEAWAVAGVNEADFLANVRVGTSGSGNERGLESAYRLIETLKDTTDESVGFRSGATVVLVFVSDERDSSSSSVSYTDYFRAHGISCHAIVDEAADAAKLVDSYIAVANATGGTWGEIHSTGTGTNLDWSSTLNAISLELTASSNSYVLAHNPTVVRRVSINGSLVPPQSPVQPDGYRVTRTGNKPRLVFYGAYAAQAAGDRVTAAYEYGAELQLDPIPQEVFIDYEHADAGLLSGCTQGESVSVGTNDAGTTNPVTFRYPDFIAWGDGYYKYLFRSWPSTTLYDYRHRVARWKDVLLGLFSDRYTGELEIFALGGPAETFIENAVSGAATASELVDLVKGGASLLKSGAQATSTIGGAIHDAGLGLEPLAQANRGIHNALTHLSSGANKLAHTGGAAARRLSKFGNVLAVAGIITDSYEMTAEAVAASAFYLSLNTDLILYRLELLRNLMSDNPYVYDPALVAAIDESISDMQSMDRTYWSTFVYQLNEAYLSADGAESLMSVAGGVVTLLGGGPWALPFAAAAVFLELVDEEQNTQRAALYATLHGHLNGILSPESSQYATVPVSNAEMQFAIEYLHKSGIAYSNRMNELVHDGFSYGWSSLFGSDVDAIRAEYAALDGLVAERYVAYVRESSSALGELAGATTKVAFGIDAFMEFANLVSETLGAVP